MKKFWKRNDKFYATLLPHTHQKKKKKNLPSHGNWKNSIISSPKHPQPMALLSTVRLDSSGIYVLRGSYYHLCFSFIITVVFIYFFFLTRHGTMFEKSSLIRAWTLEHKLPGSKLQLCLRGATWQASSVKGTEQLTSLGQRVMHARGTQNSQDTSEQATHASRYQLHLLLITDGLIWDESRNIVVEKKNLSKVYKYITKSH